MVRTRFAAAGVLTVLACLFSAAEGADPPSEGDPAAGRLLFELKWTAGDDGDGLGPMFNERSCVACHSLGGVGGAGPNSKNVDILSVEIAPALRTKFAAYGRPSVDDRTKADAAEVSQFYRNVRIIHSELNTGSVVLHSYGTNPFYESFREQILKMRPLTEPLDTSRPSPLLSQQSPTGHAPLRYIRHGDVLLQLARRNSTAMFGAGLIDRIRQADVLRAAAEQSAHHPEMKGRPAGRFGWRGQTADLKSFVAGACRIELGLSVPGGPSTSDPILDTFLIRGDLALARRYSGSAPESQDLDARKLADLTAFVSSLPRPTRRLPADSAALALVHRGERLFESLDCAVCHRPNLGDVDGIYSDLLLHDMGTNLADGQAAPLAPNGVLYYQGPSLGEELGNRIAEWRTPPLWGLADSAPYLHDGRAATVEEAIALHGGTATASADRFSRSNTDDRAALLTFLSTLVGPDAPELTPLPQFDRHTATRRQTAELAAAGRLRLASAARDRGDTATARMWFSAVVKDFPATAAAAEAIKLLDATPAPPAEK